MGETAVENRGDWQFVRDGAVTLFLKDKVLAEAGTVMVREGYSVRDIDCGTDENLIRDLAGALNWSEHFGYVPHQLNLDALNEALSCEPSEKCPKLLLIFRRFAGFMKRGKGQAIGLLDVIETRAREQLLFGHRLVAFVHTNNPDLRIEGLGARAVQWNKAEWSAKSRGV